MILKKKSIKITTYISEISFYFSTFKCCILSELLELKKSIKEFSSAKNILSSKILCKTFFLQVADVVIRKCIFAFHFVGGLIQLLIYTWTCNDIIVQSTAISDAAYNSKWYLLPNNGPGKAVKQGLIMIMIRTRRPCILTAGSFAAVSLDTFTGVSAFWRISFLSRKEIYLL